MAKIDPNEPCPCGSGKLFLECHEPLVIANRPIIINKRIPLKVISEPDPDTRSVFMKMGEGTIVFRAFANETALTCGKCGEALVVGMERNQVQNLVIKCNDCGSFNDTLVTPTAPSRGNEVFGVLNRHERRMLRKKRR
jgi:predicted RNA-binding Zn-ribbon protein involved in translation (DUF1610 family)